MAARRQPLASAPGGSPKTAALWLLLLSRRLVPPQQANTVVPPCHLELLTAPSLGLWFAEEPAATEVAWREAAMGRPGQACE